MNLVQKFYLADPAISNSIGHYSEYASSISKAVQKSGIEFIVLARSDVTPELARKIKARPTFQKDFWYRPIKSQKLGFFINPVLTNWINFVDLRRAFSRTTLDNTLIFVPTIDHYQLLGWILWMALLPPKNRPCLAMLFRYSYELNPGEFTKRSLWAKLGFALSSLFYKSGKIRFFTDSHRLSKQYQQLSGMHFSVLPIPHTGDIAYIGNDAETLPEASILNIVSLGDAREEKGYVTICKAIEKITSVDPEMINKVHFILQCFISHPSHVLMGQFTQELEKLKLPNVTFFHRNLNRSEYAALIKTADIILLPYSQRVYYARTSGPFTEALAAGKVVIVPNDTWMSDMLVQYGAGKIIKNDDPDGLVNAIIEAVKDYPHLSTIARQSSKRWTDFHNPDQFVKCLFEEFPELLHSPIRVNEVHE